MISLSSVQVSKRLISDASLVLQQARGDYALAHFRVRFVAPQNCLTIDWRWKRALLEVSRRVARTSKGRPRFLGQCRGLLSAVICIGTNARGDKDLGVLITHLAMEQSIVFLRKTSHWQWWQQSLPNTSEPTSEVNSLPIIVELHNGKLPIARILLHSWKFLQMTKFQFCDSNDFSCLQLTHTDTHTILKGQCHKRHYFW